MPKLTMRDIGLLIAFTIVLITINAWWRVRVQGAQAEAQAREHARMMAADADYDAEKR